MKIIVKTILVFYLLISSRPLFCRGSYLIGVANWTNEDIGVEISAPHGCTPDLNPHYKSSGKKKIPSWDFRFIFDFLKCRASGDSKKRGVLGDYIKDLKVGPYNNYNSNKKTLKSGTLCNAENREVIIYIYKENNEYKYKLKYK